MQGRSPETLTNADDVELETTLQELALDLRRDAVETNMALGVDGAGGIGGHRVEGGAVKLPRERLLGGEADVYFFSIPKTKSRREEENETKQPRRQRASVFR